MSCCHDFRDGRNSATLENRCWHHCLTRTCGCTSDHRGCRWSCWHSRPRSWHGIGDDRFDVTDSSLNRGWWPNHSHRGRAGGGRRCRRCSCDNWRHRRWSTASDPSCCHRRRVSRSLDTPERGGPSQDRRRHSVSRIEPARYANVGLMCAGRWHVLQRWLWRGNRSSRRRWRTCCRSRGRRGYSNGWCSATSRGCWCWLTFGHHRGRLVGAIVFCCSLMELLLSCCCQVHHLRLGCRNRQLHLRSRRCWSRHNGSRSRCCHCNCRCCCSRGRGCGSCRCC